MKTNNDFGLHLTGENAKYKKTLYTVPELRVYGKVTQSTAGSTGPNGDKGSMQTK